MGFASLNGKHDKLTSSQRKIVFIEWVIGVTTKWVEKSYVNIYEGQDYYRRN